MHLGKFILLNLSDAGHKPQIIQFYLLMTLARAVRGTQRFGLRSELGCSAVMYRLGSLHLFETVNGGSRLLDPLVDSNLFLVE